MKNLLFSESDVMEVLQQDIETLLNTHSYATDYMCKATLLEYGMPRISHFNLQSNEDQKKLCQIIKETIEKFESRLRNIEVKFIKELNTSPQFLIKAELKSQGFDQSYFEVLSHFNPLQQHFNLE